VQKRGPERRNFMHRRVDVLRGADGARIRPPAGGGYERRRPGFQRRGAGGVEDHKGPRLAPRNLGAADLETVVRPARLSDFVPALLPVIRHVTLLPPITL